MEDPRGPVREVMSRGAISVNEKLTLRSLAAVLDELDIGVALVACPDGSVGVVSERDVVRALAEGADPDEVWAADVMIDDLVLAEPEETIVDVAERMSAESVRHVTGHCCVGRKSDTTPAAREVLRVGKYTIGVHFHAGQITHPASRGGPEGPAPP
jgi:predicted transcriptional regulator